MNATATVARSPEAGMQPRTILVTGGAGFIGSHLVETLLGRGHRVSVIDDLSTGRIENIKHLLESTSLHFARASVTDAIVLDRLMSGADVVIHLAATVGVRLIVERPVRTIETNVLGTEAVLRSALRYGCRTLLASSSEVYGKGARIPFGEDDDVLLGSTSRSRWAYAASKMLDEFLGLAYFHEHGLPVVPFRLFNTVGPRQTGRYGMVVPRFMEAALAGDPIDVYGDGTQSRCFCDVADIVRALVGLAFHPDAPGTVFNVGATEETTILALAEKTKAIAGSRSEIRLVPYSEAYAPGFEDMQRRVPSTARIERLLAWKPEYSLDQILARVRDATTRA
jgi:UDP-glucose 4-epimerase